MVYKDFISEMHDRNKRNYLERVVDHDKAECALEAKKFDKNYWDGDQKYGYGGYYYDGRHKAIAKQFIEQYKLKAGDKVLDVGCGKAFLIYDMKLLIPDLEIRGLDISRYALDHAKDEIKPYLDHGNATSLPYEDNSFDLIICVAALHNLYIFDLEKALKEITRVSKKNSYIAIESYRDEREKMNLLYWQLTCESIFTPQEWKWLFNKFGYTGDHSFTFFK